MPKNFNIIITGVGGQGLITLLSVINESAFVEEYDVKSSELHGLSQRGGSVEAHVRFGEKVNSPMVSNGTADLILAMEGLEALRESPKAGKQTKILINEYFLPFIGSLSKEEIIKQLNNTKKDFQFIPASETCKNKLDNEVVCTMYMLGYAVGKNLIPLKKESVFRAIKNIIPQKYIDLNISAFKLGHD
ncbi:MAG: indolepyruvate oxidoreductase subunit beta [Candidatus Staskawiczbacteria bacterium]|nr:indolepyruvate oxidoreductase subunit beta [Candidatus Staskawiczbacteria bacterium]